MKTSWLIEGKRREVLMKQSEDQLVGGVKSEARVKNEVLGDNPRVMNSFQAVKTRGHPQK